MNVRLLCNEVKTEIDAGESMGRSIVTLLRVVGILKGIVRVLKTHVLFTISNPAVCHFQIDKKKGRFDISIQ